MDLVKQIRLRYRTAGHVRFQLPETLCQAPVAERLASDLHRIEGIYRVDLSLRQRKLSIRFIEHICDFDALSKALYRLITAVASAEPIAAPQPVGEALPAVPRRPWSTIHPVRWVRAKMQEARETVTAMRILARRRVTRERLRALASEDTVILVLNDALVLFLIKLHWTMITRQWIRQPWQFRYEWMAAGYMVYLFVRSRRPKE